MDPLPTLDLMLTAPDQDLERLRRTAGRAVAAAVSDWGFIRGINAAAVPQDARLFDRPLEAAIRHQYEAWVAAAEALRTRVARVVERAGSVDGADELRHTIGKTMAQLSVSLDAAEESARDAREGRWVSVEEVRRELRLRAKL